MGSALLKQDLILSKKENKINNLKTPNLVFFLFFYKIQEKSEFLRKKKDFLYFCSICIYNILTTKA